MKKNNKKGFTLVELVIVVAVMAILVAVAIPTVKSITKSAQSSVDNTNARTIESLIKLHEAEVASGTAKQGETAVNTVSATSIDYAITEGKLGIDGTFKYDVAAGTVSVVTDSTTYATGDYEIVCDSDAAATTTGENAASALENSVKVTKK